ncbi:transposase [Vibrio rarus]|uniref:transposase n=1 Tax=Vibrio rarus TaxID=413403 RepID=UPI0021C3EEB7
MKSLAHMYCVHICAYAIMSNHYHVVLCVDKAQALALSDEEVVERWSLNHKIPTIIKDWLQLKVISNIDNSKCLSIIDKWRDRLWSLSWFMKELNYYIACKANQEDKCKGHFWESRFKSQALLNDTALLAAMAYVDLNPVRAGIASTPEESQFTSFKARVSHIKQNTMGKCHLKPFYNEALNEASDCLPFSAFDYFQLVDWTAREFRVGKSSINNQAPPILDRLKLKRKRWLYTCKYLERSRFTAIGSSDDVKHATTLLGKSKIHMYPMG